MPAAYQTQKVTTIDIPVMALIKRANPDFDREKHRELQYDFSPVGRRFYADPYVIGAYNPADQPRAFSDGFSDGFA